MGVAGLFWAVLCLAITVTYLFSDKWRAASNAIDEVPQHIPTRIKPEPEMDAIESFLSENFINLEIIKFH